MSEKEIYDLDGTDQAQVPADLIHVAGIIKHDDGSVTLPLLYPVEIKTQVQGGAPQTDTIRELTIRRPKGGDLRAVASLTDTGLMIAAMFKRLAGMDVAVFDKLELEDALAVQEVIGNFFPASPVTGKAS